MQCLHLHGTFSGNVAAFKPQQSRGQSVRPWRIATECKTSRVGKQPVQIPKNVTVTLEGTHLTVKVRQWTDYLAAASSVIIYLDESLSVAAISQLVLVHLAMQGPKGTLERTCPDMCDIVKVRLTTQRRKIVCS